MSAVVPHIERHGSFSPDNQKIVFSTGSGFDRDLKIIDLITNEVVNLTENDLEDSHPRWSPNGEWIVFQREDTLGNRDLFLVKSDGSEEKNLTNTLEYREQHPSFSSDGKMIIFDSNRDQKDLESEEHNYEIYSFDIEENKTERLTNWKHWDMYPSFSPDNSHIVWRRTILIPGSDDKNFEIFVKNIETGKEWNITNNPSYDSNPYWNPQSDQIAFTSSRSGSFNIYLIKSDGSDLRMITQAEGRSIGFSIPTISFNGKLIVADRYTKDVVDLVIVDISDEIK
ncbi:hypothetical protein [Ekhidna sp.]|uniref:TolB family protein n=1 Tax=Ekhidna sp. TaxID=2608089 RepID=UPI003C7A93CE